MNSAHLQSVAFHAAGMLPEGALTPATNTGLQPALFAHFQDLDALRYDFPLVFSTRNSEHGPLRSLADIFDEILRAIAPHGPSGEGTRRHVLSLEQEIRRQLSQSGTASLEELWDQAQFRLLSRSDEKDRPQFEEHLLNARQSLNYGGSLRDCDHGLPADMLRHLWEQSRRPGDRLLFDRIKRLINGLEEILQLDSLHSGKAHDAGYLQSSMGTSDQVLFDFQAMSQVLQTAPVGKPLAQQRRRRIRDAIAILKSQKFVSGDPFGVNSAQSTEPFEFEFESCHAALAAFRKRLPSMAALIKAISIAELEISNHYDDKRHDEFFEGFNANAMGPEDLAMFPSYLVNVVGEPVTTKLKADILEALGSGLPFKILVQHDDILGPPPDATGQLSFGVRGQQLAAMAMGLHRVFVMQAASSSLYRLRDALSCGLSNRLPALFSVYSGALGNVAEKRAPYLLAAAATESRAFPGIVRDPARGKDLATQFSLEGNPAVKSAWAAHQLQYEDAEHHLLTENLDFTFIDFVASDPRHAGHFVTIPKTLWSEDMLPLGEFLRLAGADRAEKIPYTLLADETGVLQRAVVDDRLIDAATRCQDHWRGLQELAGINNSHANAQLAEAEAAWQQEKQQLLQRAPEPAMADAAPASQPVVQPTESAAAASATPASVAQPPSSQGNDPWIETPRCTTCNECTQLNDRMFAYNDDMQAYIADSNAGSFRELVEAAETCQVAIIHPGKPKNPDESGLDELMERAKPFM